MVLKQMFHEPRSSLAQLEIAAELDCEIDGHAFQIRSYNRRIVIEAPDVTTGLKLCRLGLAQFLRRQGRAQMRKIARLCDQARYSIELHIGIHSVGAVGYRVSSQLWHLLGLPALTLRPNRLVAAYISERRAR